MNDTSVLREALLWAAGNPNATCLLEPRHYDAFFEAAKMHRLSGRLLRRLQRDGASVPPEFADHAQRLHILTETETAKRMRLAGRLAEAMRASGRDECLILLKGCTLYALTGDPLTNRLSGDLDVIVSDLDGLVAVATQIGLVLIRSLNHLAEYAVMYSPDDGVLELHSRFDVTHIPETTTHDSIDPALHGGAWELSQHFRVDYLRHEDFTKFLGESSVLPDGVRPLRPEMAALVSASHMFKNYLRFPDPLPYATIPLDEIATFADFCALPSFDQERFDGLVAQRGGRTAVNFARALVTDLLRATPGEQSRNHRLFPSNLWWDGLDGGGFPVWIDWDPAQLVYRDRPIRDLVERLGPTVVTGPETGTVTEPDTGYSSSFALFDGGTMAASRYIFRKDRDSELTIHCTISIDWRGLILRIKLSAIRADRMIAIAAYFQDHRYEVFVNCTSREPFIDYSLQRNGADRVEVHRQAADDTCVVELRLPHEVVEDCVAQAWMHGVLVVREQVREWSCMTAGIAVPLRIRVPRTFVS